MKEPVVVKKRTTPNTPQSKRSAKPDRKDQKLVKHIKPLNNARGGGGGGGGTKPKTFKDTPAPDPQTDSEPTKDDTSDDHSSIQGKVGDSDTETIRDSLSSHGDSITGGEEEEDEDDTSETHTDLASKVASQSLVSKELSSAPQPLGFDSKNVEAAQQVLVGVLDQTSTAAKNGGNDNEFVDAEDDTLHHEDDEALLNEKIQEMEAKIERLEEELREVAALELSLYSIVPEHGSSTHKVHTPARRISRLYSHSCKHWSQVKRATIAKNTVTGLILVAKSCGNDVSRLMFWLSNTVVLRNTISQALGSAHSPSVVTSTADSYLSTETSEENSSKLNWKGQAGTIQVDAYMQLAHDWKETRTFTSALKKVESWIFSRIFESVWWKALAPHMQSPIDRLAVKEMRGKLLGPALGDQQQGSFSVNLWRRAFQDVFQELCPVRAGGHNCGCLPVLATMVMKQCIARLDVAMFNAILRESATEIPTDPVSDPIVDSRVLPIPAGELSFGSGAQLKNSIGNWSRWLTDALGMDVDGPSEEDQHTNEEDFRQNEDGKLKSFVLLNALSDLLMLPKDMLMDLSIRLEVCPSISIPLMKRILCNFTPDEFCPDPVPGAVLEALNAESIIEWRMSRDSATSFPYPASAVSYTPPYVNLADAEDLGRRAQLLRNSSGILRKGYMSDEELEELNSPLASIINHSPSSSSSAAEKMNGKLTNSSGYHRGDGTTNARYELLHEVWATCLS